MTRQGGPDRAMMAPRLTELIDPSSLEEVCGSFVALCGMGVRIVSDDGTEIGMTPEQSGVRACKLPIDYDGRRLGWLTVSLPPGERESERLSVGQELERLARHFAEVLDVLLFNGHRAYLASTMHLAVADANYAELAEKNEALQQAYDKLKQLDRLKSTFLATMSHELRTPLTSIIGYSEMLATGMGGPLSELQREFVDTIRAKGDQLLELIVSLLDVAKLEQDQVNLKRTAVSPTELADDVLRTVGPAAAKKGIQLVRKDAAGLPQLRADKGRLRQVLLNLMDNAVKFTPKGGQVTLELAPATLSLRADDDVSGLVLLSASQPAVQFTVRDTGIGIPNHEFERIFDAFYQVDGSATREHGGTGLGLAIVKRLVEAHGGIIQVASTVGQGTEFRVRIPAAVV